MSSSSETSSLETSSSEISSSGETFQHQFLSQVTTLIGAALAFIAGTALNTAVQATIDKFYPEKKRGNLSSKWIYAIIVILVVVLTLILLAYLNKNNK